ncbi:MAG TPA: HAD family phosphatase [Streptosporangiaceae bacterium]
MSYRGLILDFGGVVTTDFYGALSAFCVREGLAPDAFVHALRDTAEGRAALAAVESGRISQRAYEKTIAELLGVDDHGLLGRALADLRPRREVLELVRRVRAAGIRAGVLSNSWGSGEYDPYKGYDLEREFDAVVISDQVGLRKPDPAIYLRTAVEMGVPADECVFVDDTAANLPAAEELGMAVVHFTGTASGIAAIEELLGFR